MLSIKERDANTVQAPEADTKILFLDAADSKLKTKDSSGVLEEISIAGGGASYLVYTALLSAGPGDDPLNLTSGDLTVGVTYQIVLSTDADFTNVGAANNTIGAFFVATGTTPTSWGSDGQLGYNNGAPVVNVLENTIGTGIYFEYITTGTFSIQSNGYFTNNKTWFTKPLINILDAEDERDASIYRINDSTCRYIVLDAYGFPINLHNNLSIEIRVYP